MSYIDRFQGVAREIKKILIEDPAKGRREIYSMLYGTKYEASPWVIRNILLELRGGVCDDRILDKACALNPEAPIIDDKGDLDEVSSCILSYIKMKPRGIRDISSKFGISMEEIFDLIDKLRFSGYNIFVKDHDGIVLSVNPEPESGGVTVINLGRYDGDPIMCGVIADTHLCSKYERLDCLNALYDIYEDEGITDVYLAGNYIDGESRLNMYEIKVHGVTGQINYFIDNFPYRKGIRTHFIAGDDHEGWLAKKVGIDIGAVTEQMAIRAGREDLHYLGYLEADILFKADNGAECKVRIAHPGGGSAYSYSYKSQKAVEGYQGGEKPQVLWMGHYHKFDLSYPRGVWAMQAGCLQDQTVFMRKKMIESHVGGCIVEMVMAEDGSVSSYTARFIPFYDRKFYSRAYDNF